MQKHEEKTEDTQQSLPLDVTSEILSKLPAKSIVRFRCVSKFWSSITSDTYFIKSYKTRTRPHLLVILKEIVGHEEEYFVFSIPEHIHNPHHTGFDQEPSYGYHLAYPEDYSLSIKTELVHGLICFQNLTEPIIWNPATRKFLRLPLLKKSWNDISVCLGYDPVEKEHKVLCMPFNETSYECQVLTLGSDHQESWRTVKTKYKHCPCPYFRNYRNRRKSIYSRCINGVLYYQASFGFVPGFPRVVMRFDVRSEKLEMIQAPASSWKEFWCMKMIAFEKKLAFVGSSSMWVLENAVKPEWYKHISLPLSDYEREFKLIGSTDDGELMYAGYTFYQRYSHFSIIYVDPKRKTSRRVQCGPIVDDLRKRNRLGNRPLYEFQFFPNHIETL